MRAKLFSLAVFLLLLAVALMNAAIYESGFTHYAHNTAEIALGVNAGICAFVGFLVGVVASEID